MLQLFSLAKRFISTVPGRKNGHERPRKRMLRAPVVEPNVRLRTKDFLLMSNKRGEFSLLPPCRPNPTIKGVEVQMLGNKYRREWKFTMKPNGGSRLVPVDVRLDKTS
jgi:hypothetical protein